MYSDPTGEFAWLALLLTAVVSGGIAALVELAQGGSLGDIGRAFAGGAIAGLLIYMIPEMAYIILGYEIADSYYEHRNEGYSMSQSAMAASTNIVSNLSPAQTNDFAADLLSQAVFGSGFSLSAFGLEQITLGRENPSGQDKIRNQQQFQNHISSGLMIMGGLGSARYTCYSNRGDYFVRL